MTAERPNMPEWARRDRVADMRWINQNFPIFYLAATTAFEDSGRGAIIVDTTQQLDPGIGHPFGYFAQQFIEESTNEDTIRMVREYQPESEFVIVLLKPENRDSTYRVGRRDQKTR